MKKIIFILLAFTATTVAFAQESKAKSENNKSSSVVNQYACPMHPEVSGNKPGKCTKCGMDLTQTKKERKGDVKKYTCPMHDDVTSKKPGKCSECGTKLVLNRTGSKQANMVTYTCPMHPAEKSNTAKSCDKCGMTMVAKKSKKN